MSSRTRESIRTDRLRPLLLIVMPVLLACRSGGREPGSLMGEIQADDTLSAYLGQPRPGPDPVLFAEGIVSTDAGMYGTVVFAPDMTEAFWVEDEDPGLFFARVVDGEWGAPERLPFPEGYRLSSPFFSHDGRRLYFMAEGADIYVSELRNGAYHEPVPLPSPVNTEAPESSPNISPDGDLLLFDRWFESPPYVRIMVSFRERGGGWSEPIDLSPYTKSEGNDSAARLSPDGKYLFFQSAREGSDPNRSVYWVEAGFLETLRPERSR